jgi:2-polyprenyl-3-methyl-5-hydroxy-6-metoxy-1,4-benzoquinol methylase
MSLPAEQLDIEAPGCRFCGGALQDSFVDLGSTPPSNSYLRPQDMRRGEMFFPLHAYVCRGCFLVQLEAFHTPDQIFGDYAYFSSYSDSWLRHAERYVDAMIDRFDFGSDSRIIEIASNDGYLLQYFRNRDIPVLGIEPAANVAEVAVARGIPSRVAFFGRETAGQLVAEGRTADLMIGNNVLAHVPDLNDFVAGFKMVMKPDGMATLEFPHLLRLIEDNQFDTIYHEHFSYFSLTTAEKVFAAHGMRIFDVEQLASHGGSLRIFVCHRDANRPSLDSVAKLRDAEAAAGLGDLSAYGDFARRVAETKRRLIAFLIGASADGKTVVGYGAPAKGNTLLNYCGIGPDLIAYTVDRSPHKQGTFLPGSRIPVYHPDHIKQTRPDYVLILPWNLTAEIIAGNEFIRDWGGRFVTPIPTVKVLS